jgi:NAD(P)-dependent dehydrogenase (short-subunit alcohol dehydrogenase family)
VSTTVDNLRPAPVQIGARRLEGKSVLILGASAGIGAAAARRFAAEGASLIVAARRKDRLDDLVAELRSDGADAKAVPVDVTDEDAVQAAVQAALDRFGRLDGAFNTAGLLGENKLLADTDSEHVRRVVDINLLGSYYAMKHEIRAMVSGGGGSIVNTSSVGGLVGVARFADYSASKWAVIGMTKSAALGYGAHNVRINAIAPGATMTEMYDAWLPTDDAKARMASRSPMGQIALPDDVARAALFLLSDESRWTTGSVVVVDGGLTAGTTHATGASAAPPPGAS